MLTGVGKGDQSYCLEFLGSGSESTELFIIRPLRDHLGTLGQDGRRSQAEPTWSGGRPLSYDIEEVSWSSSAGLRHTIELDIAAGEYRANLEVDR